MAFLCQLNRTIFTGTVFRHIWWKCLLVLMYSVGCVLFQEFYVQVNFNIGDAVMTMIGLVTGLLLVFRTNTAYDRYWEGRVTWGKMTTDIRNLVRCITVSVPNIKASDLVEKISIVKIIIGFAVSTKHYLRGEYSHEYDDLQNLIAYLPIFSSPMTKINFIHRSSNAPTHPNIPILLTYYISSYMRHLGQNGVLKKSTQISMQSSLSSMTECLTSFERILNNPIPIAYSYHLTFCTWTYILTLPWQSYSTNGWWCLLEISIVSISLLGILDIGKEIENPFGYDANDLPLDTFCDDIKDEIGLLISYTTEPIHDWILTKNNYPIESLTMNAENLANFQLHDLYTILHINHGVPPPNEATPGSTADAEIISSKTKKKKRSVLPT